MPKSALGRVTENMSQYQGVVVYSMSDNPLVCYVNAFCILHMQSCFGNVCSDLYFY